MRTQNQLMREWTAAIAGGKSTFARDKFLRSLNEHETVIFHMALGAENEIGHKALEIASKRFNELSDSIKVALLPYLDMSLPQGEASISETQTDISKN